MHAMRQEGKIHHADDAITDRYTLRNETLEFVTGIFGEIVNR